MQDIIQHQEYLPIVIGSAVVLVTVLFKTLCFSKKVPLIEVELNEYEANDNINAPVHDKYTLTKSDRMDKLQCYDPASLQYLGEVENMTKEEVDEVVQNAKDAQKKWATSTFEERRQVLRILLRYIVAHSDDISRVSVRDTGKTKLGAVLGEVLATCEKLRWMIAHGEKYLKPEKRGGKSILTLHKSARIEYLPMGVLGVLAPWNYPCHNLMNHVISGIFAGNGVVIKPSEHTSWSADYFIRIIRGALEEVGYSGDLVQVVTGLGATGAALVESKVDKIIFTGSDKIGKLIMETASKNLKPVVLELGGKDPFIICESASIDSIVPIALRGVYQNCGQNCVGIERVLIHESLHDEFISKMEHVVAQMKQDVPLQCNGKAVDVGAMTTPQQLDHVQGLVDDAVAKGAKLVIGGKRNEALKPGFFFEPTILTNVNGKMRIAQEEVFGPVLTVFQFDTREELIEMANDCEYGLGSTVFTKNRKEAMEITYALEAGMTNINDYAINYLVQSLPFGGVKASGFGRFGGPEGLRSCCKIRTITEDQVSFIQTSIPKPLAYPTVDNSSEIASQMVNMAYGNGVTGKLSGLVQFLRGIVF